MVHMGFLPSFQVGHSVIHSIENSSDSDLALGQCPIDLDQLSVRFPLLLVIPINSLIRLGDECQELLGGKSRGIRHGVVLSVGGLG